MLLLSGEWLGCSKLELNYFLLSNLWKNSLLSVCALDKRDEMIEMINCDSSRLQLGLGDNVTSFSIDISNDIIFSTVCLTTRVINFFSLEARSSEQQQKEWKLCFFIHFSFSVMSFFQIYLVIFPNYCCYVCAFWQVPNGKENTFRVLWHWLARFSFISSFFIAFLSIASRVLNDNIVSRRYCLLLGTLNRLGKAPASQQSMLFARESSVCDT